MQRKRDEHVRCFRQLELPEEGTQDATLDDG